MKRLVVCCDGTWNTPDQKDRGVMRPTNVVKLARWVLPQAGDGTVQKTHYDRGVGTGDFIDRLFGGAFGVGLAHNVREAYEFLSLHYAEGDEVYCFGFSRGAYTVRRTVGMLRKCGLVPNAGKATLKEAYDLYSRRETRAEGGADSKAALAFRAKYGAGRIPIRFLGVWDTVGGHGIAGVLGQLGAAFSKARFHDRVLSSDVEHACHAVAIDECRRLFQPTLFQLSRSGAERGHVLEQSWFAGVHGNVGGGYENTGLSDIALHWMAARAQARGLALDPRWRARLDPDEFGELRNSRTGIYALLGKSERVLGAQEAGFERAHVSPVTRVERDPARYEPQNLKAYLKSPGCEIDVSEP
ncbi:MAG: DUF2235 domain-containing protein [Burkholderiales bacterium]